MRRKEKKNQSGEILRELDYKGKYVSSLANVLVDC